MKPNMNKQARFSTPTVLMIAAVVAAGAFAAGRSGSLAGGAVAEPEVTETLAATHADSPNAPSEMPPGHPSVDPLPPGHPGAAGELPPGHPPLDEGATFAASTAAAEHELAWKTSERWELVPSTSSMRLATYRIPKQEGDAEAPEMSVTRAGGSVDANAQRWIDQFGPEATKTAQRTTRKVGELEVTIVEVEGKFAGGMGSAARDEDSWALLGAIVSTPGMPYFFKLTGPTKSVKAAKPEFDALISSLALR